MAMVAASERGIRCRRRGQGRKISKRLLASKIFFEPKDLMKLDGVPGQTMTTGYTLIALAAEKYPGDSLTDAMACGPLPPSLVTAVGTCPRTAHLSSTVRLQALPLVCAVLQLYGPPAKRKEFDVRIAKARHWLEQNTARDNEGRTFRLLGLGWAGAERNMLKSAVEDLVRNQRADGGWAQLPGLESDAYATGQALYALRIGGGMSPISRDLQERCR
jgi:hypothetical protein